MIEHLLIKDYNNDILKNNNYVHLNIFYEFPRDLHGVLNCPKVSHCNLHLLFYQAL
jgi:hypothetical protein